MKGDVFNSGDIVVFHSDNGAIVVQVDGMNASLTFRGQVVYSESHKTKMGFVSSGWSVVLFQHIKDHEVEKYKVTPMDILMRTMDTFEKQGPKKVGLLARHGL